MIDLEMKLKVIKDYEGGKSVMVIAHQSCMSHSTMDTIFKNRNKVTEAVEGSAPLRVRRHINPKRASIRHGKSPEAYPSQPYDDHS